MKKSTKKLMLLVLVFAVTSVMFGCRSNSSDPNAGFTVKGVARVFNPQQTLHIDYATGGNFQGVFLSGDGTSGTITSFDVNESFFAYNVRGAKVPGRWRIGLRRGFVLGSLCALPAVKEVNVRLGSEETIVCFGGTSIFISQPDTVDAFNPPSTITLTGSGIEDTYGMPKVAIYDEYGNVGASVTATQLSSQPDSDMQSLTFNPGDLSQAYDGVYNITVSNVNADGSWSIVGGAIVSVYGNPPPPPDPGPGPGGGCEPQPQGYEQLPCYEY